MEIEKLLKNIWIKNLIVGSLSLLIGYLFFISRPEWSFEHKFWRAIGDTGFILLILILLVGPLVKLFPKHFVRFLSWRKELGIWMALSAFLHTFLILKDWVQWDYMKFFGFVYVPEAQTYVSLEPGFGMANLIGLFAIFFTCILFITSSNKAIQFLGVKSWKFLHSSVNIIFYLVFLHVFYFLFIHYSLTPFKAAANPDWFRYPFLIISSLVPIFQTWAFVKTVKLNKK
jgi:sulfoxide reductase heme-binding subunit YedZ